jgi:PPP family 3-phenylpropionic acid transporter
MSAARPFGSGARFSLFYVCVFFAAGVQLPFWPLWLSGRGLSAEEVGFLLAIGTWARVAVVPLFGQIADKTQAVKELLFLCAGGSLIAFLCMPLGSSFWILFALQIPAYALTQPLLPLADGQAMQAVKRGEMDYGRVRLWGSLSFILAVLATGQLVERSGSGVVLWLLVCGTLATGLAVLGLPRAPRLPPPATPPRHLLRDGYYLHFLATAALLQASHAVYYAFSALHWKASGISESLVGLLWGLGVVAEILLFFLGRPLVARLRPTSLLILAALGGIIRWSLLALTTDLWLLFPAQALHALTFGAAHLGAMYWISGRIDPSRASSGLALLAAAVGGAMGLLMFVTGPLYEAAGGKAYFAMTLLSASALLLGAALRRRRDPYLVP